MPLNHGDTHMAKGSITSVDDLVKQGYVWAVGTAEEINSKQLGWWFVVDYPLVTVHKRIQVRNIVHLAPPTEVNTYAQMMKLGDQFPPVIVTKDGYLVDGHTRTEAARRTGFEVFPTFVLNVDYGNLNPNSPLKKQLLKLGAAQNNKHGRRMTASDIAGLIEQVSEGDTPKQISRDMHVGSSTANTVWNAARAKRLAKELHIDLPYELTNSHLKLFGGKIERYTRPVWGELLKLTVAAHLPIPDITDLMHRVEALGSEADRLRLIESETTTHQPAINAKHRVTPSQARRVKQALGVVLKDEWPPELLIEEDPVRGPKYLKDLMDAEQKIRKIIHQQEQVESSRTVQ